MDDDQRLLELTANFLERHGLTVHLAMNSADLDGILAAFEIDVVVLDLMLPGEDGLTICKRLSLEDSRPGIIMVSAIGEETDRIIGLEIGADDYLSKPCNPRELLARVRALLRRKERIEQTARPAPLRDKVYRFSGWEVSTLSRRVRAPDGTVISLTGQEFALLHLFLQHPGQVLSRDEILQLTRGKQTHAFDRIIDAQISRLRKKMHTYSGSAEELIQTVRHEGYIFVGALE